MTNQELVSNFISQILLSQIFQANIKLLKIRQRNLSLRIIFNCHQVQYYTWCSHMREVSLIIIREKKDGEICFENCYILAAFDRMFILQPLKIFFAEIGLFSFEIG